MKSSTWFEVGFVVGCAMFTLFVVILAQCDYNEKDVIFNEGEYVLVDYSGNLEKTRIKSKMITDKTEYYELEYRDKIFEKNELTKIYNYKKPLEAKKLYILKTDIQSFIVCAPSQDEAQHFLWKKTDNDIWLYNCSVDEISTGKVINLYDRN